MVSAAEIAPGVGRAGSLGVSEATEVADAAVELADGVVVASPLDGADDDPELFAVASEELFVCADTEELARDCADPAVVCFDPDLAPPVPAALPEPATADRFDVAVDFPDELADEEFPLVELEFDPAADDPVDVSAHATP